MEHQSWILRLSGKGMGRRARWALILAICTSLYAVIGFFIVPWVLRSKLESILTEQLDHPVTVEEVQCNPFALSLTVRKLAISERDQSPLVGFHELYVNVEVASLLNRALTFSAISLQYPYAVVKLRKDGSLNLADLHPPAPEADQPEIEAGPNQSGEQSLPGVIIEALHVDRGIFEFHDDSKPTPFTTHIVPISFLLRNFTTRQESLHSHELNLTAEIGPGEGIEWRGSLYIQPLRSEGTVWLTGLKVRTLWEYMKDLVNFEITDGVIDLKASYQIRSGAGDLRASVDHTVFRLTNFALGEKGGSDTLISIPEFTVAGIEADLATRRVKIAKVSSSRALIAGWLDKEGRTNFQRLFVNEANGATPVQERPSPQAKPESDPEPWLVNIDKVSIEEYLFKLEDRKPATPVRLVLNPVNIKLANVTSQLDSKVDLDFFVRINDSGTVTAAGGLWGQPLAAELDLDVAKIALPPFQPYVDQIARLRLKSGAVNLKGHLSYHAEHDKKPQIRYAGKVSLADLLTQDKLLNKDFLKWSDLALNGLDIEIEPTKLKVSEIVARKPYLRFIIGADRSTNIQQLLVKPDSQEPAVEQKPSGKDSGKLATEAAVPVRIGVIRFVDASAHFADFSLKPVIDTGIFGLNGAIKGLSSKELARADVLLEGKVDKYAPVSIKGKINPLTSDAFTDLGVSFKNVELTTVSPYSTKFAGYPIKKGKVSFDLQYKLSKKILEAENKVVIDQITLGDKVESPDATSLPVKLAIALLKDRNGVIDIDLPVRGDLNDPDFKYGKVLLGVLMNLLTKAVTAPFNLIAGLVGGDNEELNVVEFPVGDENLTAASQEKLATLANGLKERPGLQLEITGAVDAEADRAVLAEVRLNQDLLAFKKAQLKSDGKPVPAAMGFTQLPEAEQAELVKALYVKKFGKLPEPSQPEARQGDQPVSGQIQALKARLLGEITVDDSEIRLLGQHRAKQIQDYLVTQGGIPPERIFLLDVKVDVKAANGIVASDLSLTAA